MILKSLFAINPATGLPPFRIYLLRLYYILMIVVLGKDVWTTILTHQEAWDPMRAVGYSLWGTFAVLSIIGLLQPIKMLPIILLNITYKIIWLAIVAYPLWSSGELEGSGAEGLTKSNFIGFLIDLVVIPWIYVFKNFLFSVGRIANSKSRN